MPNKFWIFENKVKNSSGEESADLILYGSIGDDSWADIDSKEFAKELRDLGNIKTLNVHINSGGGSVFAGQAIHSQLKRHSAHINVYVDGLAASIASVIAMAGDRIIMPKNAMMMVHHPLTIGWGNAKEFRDIADTLDQIAESIIATYIEKTNLPHDKIVELMDNETWMSAREAVDLGFADEVEGEMDMKASINDKMLVLNDVNFDLSKYKNVPNQTFEHFYINKSEKIKKENKNPQKTPKDITGESLVKDKEKKETMDFTKFLEDVKALLTFSKEVQNTAQPTKEAEDKTKAAPEKKSEEKQLSEEDIAAKAEEIAQAKIEEAMKTVNDQITILNQAKETLEAELNKTKESEAAKAEALKTAEFVDKVENEFGNIAGTKEEKAELLKDLSENLTEETYNKVLDVFTAYDKVLAEGTKAKGADDKKGDQDGDLEAKLDNLVKAKIAENPKLNYYQAYREVRNENIELIREIEKAESEGQE